MKAAIMEAPGRLMLDEVAMPLCPDGGLLMKTQACSICSTDVKMFQRGYRDVHYPRTLGHEVAGVVVESRTPGAALSLFWVAPGDGSNSSRYKSDSL